MIKDYTLYILAVIAFYPLHLIRGIFRGIGSFIIHLEKAHIEYSKCVERLTEGLRNVKKGGE